MLGWIVIFFVNNFFCQIVLFDTTILADVMSRYKKNYGDGTFFSSGMDEPGQKIGIIAKKENISCQELVDKM